MDAHGFTLMAKTLSGDAWRQQHDCFEDAILSACDAADVEARGEPSNLFAGAMAPAARTAWVNMPHRMRQHITPDLLIDWPPSEDPAECTGIQLGECKTIHVCPTRYKPAHGDERGAAVKARARSIPAEYEARGRGTLTWRTTAPVNLSFGQPVNAM